MPYIEIERVSKKFKEEIVLHDINVFMERGGVYGFSGNNGSGKTVLMKCICGFLPVTEGTIRVNGKVIGREIDFPEDIGVIIETPGFLTNLTGMRNLEILAALRGRISRKEIEAAIRKAGLDPKLKKAVSKYSLGMRQRLGIAQAIMEDPEFLILDEPFNGLDKHGVADIRALLLELKKQGKTIILASHNSEDIRILCDKVYEWMEGGCESYEKYKSVTIQTAKSMGGNCAYANFTRFISAFAAHDTVGSAGNCALSRLSHRHLCTVGQSCGWRQYRHRQRP